MQHSSLDRKRSLSKQIPVRGVSREGFSLQKTKNLDERNVIIESTLKNIKCKGTNKGSWSTTCIDKACKQNMVMCSLPICSCRQKHKNCAKKSPKDLIHKVIEKSLVPFKCQFLDEINLLIQQLKNLWKKTQQKLTFFDDKERQFFFKVRSAQAQTFSSITGNWMFELNEQLFVNKVTEQLENKIMQQIPVDGFDYIIEGAQSLVDELKNKKVKIYGLEEIIEEKIVSSNSQQGVKQQLRMPFEEISEKIQLNLEKQVSMKFSTATKIDSKIITSDQQIYTLLQMFPQEKKPTGFNLLFRASNNNFKIKHKNKYCNIPKTIFLIKTQHGKIIGGYTPVKWKISNRLWGCQYQRDITQKSFIFSLSNGKKISKRSITVGHYNNYGPVFQKLIGVSDKSNELDDSFAFADLQMNRVYSCSTEQFHKDFSGSVDGYFCTEEWEVHKVLFR